MQNATEIYRKLNLETKLSPGNFLRNKQFKDTISKKSWKKEDSEYFFDDNTYETYLGWVQPSEPEVKEDETTSETQEMLLLLSDKIGEVNAIDYINKLLKWFVVDQSYHTLSIMLETDQPMKYVANNLDKCLKTYLQLIYNHVELCGHLKRNEIRNLCTDMHKTFNSLWVSKFHNNICFEKGNVIWQTSNTNKLIKVERPQ